LRRNKRRGKRIEISSFRGRSCSSGRTFLNGRALGGAARENILGNGIGRGATLDFDPGFLRRGSSGGLDSEVLGGARGVRTIRFRLWIGNSRGATTKEFFTTGIRLGEVLGHQSDGIKEVYSEESTL
jgi:hypothetical protein